jgi:hypothetical protein
MITPTWQNTLVKLLAHADGSLWQLLRKINQLVLSGLYTHCNSDLTVSVHEMMQRGFRVSCCLIAEGQQQVLRNVSALVLKRCNSTVAFTEARPEEWDYAKPFKDMPGPKPLPIIGNVWRFIPYIGKVPYCLVTPLKVHRQSETM